MCQRVEGRSVVLEAHDNRLVGNMDRHLDIVSQIVRERVFDDVGDDFLEDQLTIVASSLLEREGVERASKVGEEHQ